MTDGRVFTSEDEAAVEYGRDYLKRTIATVRNHRDADNCWPQWANIFADEIERLWVIEDHYAVATRALQDYAEVLYRSPVRDRGQDGD